MSASALGAAIGASGGLGLVLVASRLSARRVRFDDRVAPYLRSPRSASALLAGPELQTPFPTLERLIAPVMADGVRLVARLGSPSADLRRRLERAGRPESVEQFRAAQVVWGVLGLAAGLALALMAFAGRGTSLAVGAVLVVLGGLAGVVGRDQHLSRQVRGRQARMLAELPTVAELLALSVGAGEGPVGALERVVRTTRGALADELARTLADARAGTPLTQALRALADRTSLAPLTRFTEGVAIAIERGTPLAQVLRAQAQDVRESGRQALMEAGGRKEVAMMVPVVFLILPVTVAFAAFPSLVVLRLGQ
ncbi:type II secretion system F family protein [Pengzhenrongella sicca]|uniref:Type II secretion system F family protein n=1 Tax=Pengzhenrongella sicca TaxID=2819238 RepID=A0A8A4ZHA4_9MICO|nr:type II secretion system F family protein [Pengzhenrongella sicca]QTE30359.1 type II secretion system F family protein [Pengzhenrongella sicca]